ncbi:MAG: alpha-amylase family glycosyl hydrolase [Thermodesulfobacteriota bacterium]|nr:alpha-amylase family glycosyl hydrolase [Thermodesulfobacteriota bacterium]
MKRPEKMIIYNLFPLLAGRFSDWEKHLLRASEMGFNWVFVNPIHLPGRSGSVYAIRDYFSFNPVLVDKGSKRTPEEQVKEMAAKAEELGIKLMVDLVINHSSIDSELITLHPEWYAWDGKGKVVHPFCKENGKKVVWKDLAKFDHRAMGDKQGLVEFYLNVIRFLTGLGFKGFRCDAAYQVPKSMWERLIGETKEADPDILFFAETLGCQPDQTRETAKAGFDYIFNSSKWWDFNSHWLMKQYALTRDVAPSIGFPESHDTVRLCEEVNGNLEGLKQRYFFSALFSAGVMMPMGFEFGFRKKLHVVNTRPSDWEITDIDLTSFLKRVNQIKAEHPVFQEEAPTEMLNHGNPNVLLMWKASTTTQEESLIILNKDAHNRQHFWVEDLHGLVQAGAPLVDLSPEDSMDYIPTPFSYELRPGQGIILMTARDRVLQD